jgi:bifunctional non-homologous end joining protein LigD
MGLQVYRKKRKFEVTPEPRGRTAKKTGNRFVVQKHAARRLHYDFRLELDGVMKSWAVTRGPSLVPGEKRLAVHVEDHPVEYNDFEGTIPQGQYGGGTVMIWDRGEWHPEGDPHKGYRKGRLDFTLEGNKLRGGWHLVRMNRRSGESKEPWLLIKARDEAARGPDDPDILEEQPLSVASGRSIPEIAEGKGKKRVWHSNRSVADNVKGGTTRGTSSTRKTARAKTNDARATNSARLPPPLWARVGEGGEAVNKGRASTSRPPPPAPPHKGEGSAPSLLTKSRKTETARMGTAGRLPEFVAPSLATLHAEPPSGSGWVHEIKFDGYRIQARLERGKVQLLTRKGLDWTKKFPNIAAAVKKLSAHTALIDGEVIIVDEKGVSTFSGLQAALKAGEQETFIYYVFDLLHIDGRNLSELPLVERKDALAHLVGHDQRGAIRLSEHFAERGEDILHHACEMGLEGIVSKRADSPYRSGRTDTFIKTKCENAQEFVVGGYSSSTAMERAIGALVVGYYQDGRLVYAGRIGTGYTQAVARDLWKRLHPIETDKPPFDDIPRQQARRRDICWVEPRMVIESHFRGWTADNLVRQAAFKGIREDKPPREVTRELPIPPPKGEGGRAKRDRVGAQSNDHPREGSPHPTAVAALRHIADASHRRSSALRTAADGRLRSPLRGEVSSVRFTHPERVYWEDVGVTKQNLADYYRAAWLFMAPHVVDRPLALVRCPDGTKGECFFQKHASAGLAEKHLKTVIDKNRRQIIAVEDLDGILSLVQAGVLEVHVRGSLIDRLDLCDRIVLDMDPGPGVPWSEVIAAARDARERLDGIDLLSFVKLTGGKGLHVVLPIAPVDWDTAKTFAQAVALAMQADAPDRYVTKITKSLRKGKILIDYLRNSLEQTAVAAYSSRAREGAPVSVPVSWEELSRTKAGNQYTVLNLEKRIKNLESDPWKDLPRIKQKLPDLHALGRR